MLSDRKAEAFVVTYFSLANSIKNRLLYILQLLLGDPNAIQSLVGDWQVFYDSFDVKISLSTIYNMIPAGVHENVSAITSCFPGT